MLLFTSCDTCLCYFCESLFSPWAVKKTIDNTAVYSSVADPEGGGGARGPCRILEIMNDSNYWVFAFFFQTT